MKISSVIAGCMRWGTWGANFSTQDYTTIIQQCIDNGITTFDHADIYGHYTTEATFGKALIVNPSLRKDIQLITKCGIQMPAENRPDNTIKSYNTSAKHIISSVEQSLNNFGTDYIDCLLIHRPDPLLNAEEVANAMEVLIQSGKVLEFGVSNFLPHQSALLQQHIKLAYNQIEISLTNTASLSDGTLEFAMQHGIGIMVWSPMGKGLFAGEHPKKEALNNVFNQLAVKYNCLPSQIPLAWINQLPSKPICVTGSSKIERIKEAKDALNIAMERQDWYLLLEIAMGKEVA